MDAREQLQRIVDERQGRLAAGMPPDREAALLALLAEIDRLPLDADVAPRSDVLTGRSRPGVGVPTALRLCLAAEGGGDASAEGWASAFLAACRDLEAARLVLRFSESGTMRLAVNPDGSFDAWHAARRPPAPWVERVGLDAWANRLAREVPATGADRLSAARGRVARMAYQLPYPAVARLGGVPVGVYRDVLAALIARVLGPRDPRSEGRAVAEAALVGEIATALGLDPALAGRALSGFTLDREGAAWHAALPGGPQAPLVRLGPDRLAWSVRGLLSEPLFFLGRELRRRDPEAWHNGASAREEVFRQDLYRLFADRRFVSSPARIVLRDAERRNRTDIDAAIFDRKTGTLALFELKSQDPLARSAAELARQQENLRRAAQQVSAVLDWINRHGADELLNRIDPGTAKRFGVRRVLPFVLGRYLADAGERARDRGVAWGSWPQVLRLVGDPDGRNPLLALHAGLMRDDGATVTLLPPADAPPVEIRLGETRLTVHASWAALQAGRAEAR